MPLASLDSGKPTLATRSGISWGIDAPSEDSSVLVTGTPSGHYIDIRFALSGPSTQDPFWAFSGQSTYSSLSVPSAGDSQANGTSAGWAEVIRGEWAHPIDSMGNFSGTDKADVITLASGDQVEFGLLAHPDTGLPSLFKEYWTRPADYAPEDDDVWARAGYESEGEVKGVMIRVGKFVQGIIQLSDNEVLVGRWKLGTTEWQMDEKSDPRANVAFDVDWLVSKDRSEEVQIDGRSWKIVEESSS